MHLLSAQPYTSSGMSCPERGPSTRAIKAKNGTDDNDKVVAIHYFMSYSMGRVGGSPYDVIRFKHHDYLSTPIVQSRNFSPKQFFKRLNVTFSLVSICEWTTICFWKEFCFQYEVNVLENVNVIVVIKVNVDYFFKKTNPNC